MCHARRGGPGRASRTNITNLDCVFVENVYLFVAPKEGGYMAFLGPLTSLPHLTHTKGRVKESLSVVLRVVQDSHHIDALFLVCFPHLLPHLI